MKNFKDIRNRIKYPKYKEIEFVEDVNVSEDVYIAHPRFKTLQTTDTYESSINTLKREVKHYDKANRDELIGLVRMISVALPHLKDTYMVYGLLTNLISGEVITCTEGEVVLLSNIAYDESDEFIETEIKYNNPYADVFVEWFNKKNIYFRITLGEIVRIQAFVRCNAIAYCNDEYDSCIELLENVIVESQYLTREYEKNLKEMIKEGNPFGI